MIKDGNIIKPRFVFLMHSEAKQTETSEFGAEKGLLQGPCKEKRWLVLQRLELSHGFQGSVFKGKVREGSCRVCDQLMHNSLIG